MKITYEVNLAACLAFNDHQLKISPFMKKSMRKGQMWWASGPLLGGLAIAVFKSIPPERTLIFLSILALAISMPMFFFYPRYFKRCTRKHVKSFCEGNSSNGVLGLHEMEVSEECLTEKTEYSENKIQWESISRIDSTSDYTFAYIDESTAYIFPKNNIVEGDYTLFVSMLNEIYEKSQASQKINQM